MLLAFLLSETCRRFSGMSSMNKSALLMLFIVFFENVNSERISSRCLSCSFNTFMACLMAYALHEKREGRIGVSTSASKIAAQPLLSLLEPSVNILVSSGTCYRVH